MVLRGNLTVCLGGILAGLPLALGAARLLRSMLFGVAPDDPLTIAAALIGLGLVALAASLVPAYRAASITPTTALRYE